MVVWSEILGSLVLNDILWIFCAYEVYKSWLSHGRTTVKCDVSYTAYLKGHITAYTWKGGGRNKETVRRVSFGADVVILDRKTTKQELQHSTVSLGYESAVLHIRCLAV